MKTKHLLWVFFCYLTSVATAQSNQEIAQTYFKKAERAMEKIDYNTAQEAHEKGVAFLGEINSAKVAQQGIYIYYELQDYTKVKELFDIYFSKQTNKTSEEHQEMLTLFVDVEKKILAQQQAQQQAQEKAIEEQKIKEAKQKAKQEQEQRIKKQQIAKNDSLKKVWTKAYQDFTINVDEILPYNHYGIAIFKKNLKIGLLDERGNKLVKAREFEAYLENGKYIILLDKVRKPEVVYYFNCRTKKGEYLLEPFEYDSNAEFFEKVMSPNANTLVLYPNNSIKTILFDLTEGETRTITDLKNSLKKLKKADKIDRFDDEERKVRIDKIWYYLGNHLGEGVFTLYNEQKKLEAFLFTKTEDPNIDRYVLNREQFHFLGYFHGNKAEAAKSRKRFWIDSKGEKTANPKQKKYHGDLKIIKEREGNYKLLSGNTFVLENQKLENLKDYLKKHQ